MKQDFMQPRVNDERSAFRQDQYSVSYLTEFHANMNAGGHAMIADAARLNHATVVKHKDLSARTERREEHPNPPNVNNAFTILPKSYYNPMPNNFGEPVHHELFKKAGRAAEVKGGNRRG